MTTPNNNFNQPTAGQADWDASLNGNFTIGDRGFHVTRQAGVAINTGHVLWQNSGGFLFPFNPNSASVFPQFFSYTAASSGDSIQVMAWGAISSLGITSNGVVGQPLYTSLNTPGVVVGSYAGANRQVGFALPGYGLIFMPDATLVGNALAGLTDVNTNGVSSGSILMWSDATSKWVAAAPGAGAGDMQRANDFEIFSPPNISVFSTITHAGNPPNTPSVASTAYGMLFQSGQAMNAHQVRACQINTIGMIFTATARMAITQRYDNFHEAGIVLSDTIKYIIFGRNTSDQLFVSYQTNSGTFGSTPKAVTAADAEYLRVKQDASSLYFQYSRDGRNFSDFLITAKAAHVASVVWIGPGAILNSASHPSDVSYVTVPYWNITTP